MQSKQAWSHIMYIEKNEFKEKWLLHQYQKYCFPSPQYLLHIVYTDVCAELTVP